MHAVLDVLSFSLSLSLSLYIYIYIYACSARTCPGTWGRLQRFPGQGGGIKRISGLDRPRGARAGVLARLAARARLHVYKMRSVIKKSGMLL